ncbi:crotonase/enoyl-CoA hydratase family protein [Ovoidimarina sediminis]|uniref:crotonase/enoyl-CoA hydratase family protein n=1 Tax=Ovoidimarina sediminis TaxID=3079856 RepID=UPI002908250E|nr:crotonase/enoyl-CoA hydratase family protein [Rhodophyticola sp. MJ-SS7]MDU8943127.1 crotonase/enoyl-CoA hydratase family protein [Rhodophyticola sp. MJ-SS7]
MSLVALATDGPVTTITLNRPDKRNAMSDALLDAIGAVFRAPPEGTRVIVIHGAGGHYCSGLDLSEQQHRNTEEAVYHSRGWHAALDRIQFGGLPVVSAMTGAVIGGGLELATATHVRIAEPSVRFQLPEGRRGIFVGGGASVRVGRILGADRMTEMMLTGRSYGAEEGLRLGLAHELVGDGEALARAQALALQIAGNAPLSNYMMIQGLARIADMPREDGFFTESLAAAITMSSPDALEGLKAFLEKRPPRFR